VFAFHEVKLGPAFITGTLKIKARKAQLFRPAFSVRLEPIFLSLDVTVSFVGILVRHS
jgi:hypothetical protein